MVDLNTKLNIPFNLKHLHTRLIIHLYLYVNSLQSAINTNWDTTQFGANAKNAKTQNPLYHSKLVQWDVQ
jgi:hypothetical protein